MINFEEAVEIASIYHKGQKDLDGKPVLLHPLAVALIGNNEMERIVGVLHDVIEDTECSFTDLEKWGVSKNVINTLELLTHKEGQSCNEYLLGIITSGNITALNVKINDLRHNISRNNEDSNKKKIIKAKHKKALKKIENYLMANIKNTTILYEPTISFSTKTNIKWLSGKVLGMFFCFIVFCIFAL